MGLLAKITGETRYLRFVDAEFVFAYDALFDPRADSFTATRASSISDRRAAQRFSVQPPAREPKPFTRDSDVCRRHRGGSDGGRRFCV